MPGFLDGQSAANQVEAIYTAYFGRAGDGAGYLFWTGTLPATPTPQQIIGVANAFAQSPEAKGIYALLATPPTVISSTDPVQKAAITTFVNTVYHNLFGHGVPAGDTYWADQIGAGTITVGNAVYAIANGAVDSKGVANADGAILANKIAAATTFTSTTFAAGLGATNSLSASFISAAQNAVSTVTDATSLKTSQTNTSNFVSGSSSGASSVFTTSLDNLSGTAGNDTFTGDNTGATPTVTVGDQINGLGGTNTFNYFVSQTAPSIVLPQTTNIQNVTLLGSPGSQTADFSTVTGLSAVTLKAPAPAGSADTINLPSGATFGLDNVTAATELVNVPASATAATIALSNGTNMTGGVVLGLVGAGSGPSSLTVSSTGASNTLAALTTPAGVTSLTVTGSAGLKITGALNAAINTVDGSAGTAAQNLTLGTTTATSDSVKTGSGADIINIAAVGADKVTVALGAGNDVLKVGGAGGIGAYLLGTTLDGGDGTGDVVNITDGAAYTAATAAFLSNFEVLDVSGGTGTYDVSLSSFATAQLDASVSGVNTGGITFSNAPQSFTFNVASAKGADLAVAGGIIELLKTDSTAPATDSVTVNLTSVDGNNNSIAEGKITIPVLTLNTIENVTISSNISTADTGVKATAYVETITSLVDANLTNLTFTGNASTVVGALSVATSANLVKVDASAATGNVTLNFSLAVKGVQYTGSSGVDTIQAGTGGTVIVGNGGNDQITLIPTGTANDQIVYKAASDAQVTADVTGANISATSSIETVTNFLTNTAAGALGAGYAGDTISLTNIGGFTGVGATTMVIPTPALPLSGTFAAASTGFFTNVAGTHGVVLDAIGGDTYVFVDVDHNGNLDITKDIVIKVAGVTNMAQADFAF